MAEPIRRRRGGAAGGDDARGERGRGGKQEPKKGKGALIAFLLVHAIIGGAIAAYFLLPADQQQQIQDMFSGSGGRAAKAGIAFAVMLGLVFIALPTFHGGSKVLKNTLLKMKQRPTALRVLLFPFEIVVSILWGLFQLLFIVDALAIVACGLIFLVLVLRIIDDSILENFLPEILK